MIVLEKLSDGYYFHGRFGLIRAEVTHGPCVVNPEKVFMKLGVTGGGELMILTNGKMAVAGVEREAS